MRDLLYFIHSLLRQSCGFHCPLLVPNCFKKQMWEARYDYLMFQKAKVEMDHLLNGWLYKEQFQVIKLTLVKYHICENNACSSVFTFSLWRYDTSILMLSQHLTRLSEFKAMLITYYVMILESRRRPTEFYGIHVGQKYMPKRKLMLMPKTGKHQ